ncbi:hypothetical protein ACFFQW_39765 [Umezawaea endophytica]|uniref:Membrane protein YfhO n=1 Tax=Umezawaea endophytica TaxID=1654476 RepID=A0A9X2VT84_9PSEU|nr:hypothetical protein [Umezawaea endophytica]MCS7482216.1 hypothetical protein [Umezawaea endophytica]
MNSVARRPLHGGVVAFGVCLAVVLLAQLPFLRNRFFYVWDDSSAQFLPSWHYLGEQFVAGDWPKLMSPDNWVGGNFAGEALFGLWNPVNVANYVLVSRFDDLSLAALVVKTEFLALLALGTYLLVREYGAGRGAAAAIAVALPFGGFTLYYDAASWAAGLMAFAWIPFTWWSARRVARGAGSPLWPFLFGALAVTTGNPYGLLGVCAVLFALLVESWFARDRAAVIRVFVVGVLIGLVVPLVYLPLLGTSAVTDRAGQGFASNGVLVPALSDFLSLSTPSQLPMIWTFGNPLRLSVPGMYFAWFVVPLLPWLDWGVLRRRWRELLGVFVVMGGYLLLATGPSNMWMFRFPLRHVEVVFLAVGIVFAVLLSSGLRKDRLRSRALITAGVLLFTAYVSFSADAWSWRRHAVSLVVLAVGTALAVRLSRGRGLYVVLVAGVAAVLALQTAWFPKNADVADYGLPNKVSERRAMHDYQGTTFQVGSVVIGNNGLLLDAHMVSSYTGMGNRKFNQATCLNYEGTTCPQSLDKLLKPTDLAGQTLLDLLRVETVVVQRAVNRDPQVPPGWQVTERNDLVTVLRRGTPLAWPDGRVGWTDVNVSSDVSTDRSETVRFTGSGTLAFARLAWPGYRAEVDGKPVDVREGPAGLVLVDVRDGGELKLTWSAPGLVPGLAAAALGLLGALGFSALLVIRRRRAADVSADQAS